MLKNHNISKIAFLLGTVVFFISYILPINIIEDFTRLKPLGLSTIFLCPIIGIIGVIFAIKEKTVLYGVLNFLLILSFPIIMLIGNIIFK